MEHILPPVALLLHPAIQLIPEGTQTEEKMFRVSGLRCAAAQPAMRLFQLKRVKRFTALVTLVSPGILEATEGAFTLYVAIREVTLTAGTIG